MDQDPVRAKHQMSKSRDLVPRGEQNHERPMMQLVPMAKAKRLEVRQTGGVGEGRPATGRRPPPDRTQPLHPSWSQGT